MTTPRLVFLEGGGGATSTLADDARRGLSQSPRSIPPKHFYDARGSDLFDRICTLPEYYLTRAEQRLLERVGDALVGESGAATLVELGSGMARKTGLLVEAICARAADPLYVPLDISRDALAASSTALLERHPRLRIRAVLGEFPRDLPTLARTALVDAPTSRLFAFLGSTIGNLDETEAPALVRGVADIMAEGDAFLLGVDLVKDRRVLEAAYDDAAGVTAQFNKNVLTVIDRELDADFDLDAFVHEAYWDGARARIEMRLVSLRAQRVRVGKLGMVLEIAEGERILTEICRKFTRATATQTLALGNMKLVRWEETDDGAFALALARRV